jgi:hypothetical protein
MIKINWRDADPLFINPKFGLDLEGNPSKGIPIPTYGNYGGPNISGPELPVDELDALFQVHDDAMERALVSENVLTPEELVQPHATLINDVGSLLNYESVDDAETTLYGGFSIFALTAHLAQFGLLRELEMALDPTDASRPFVFDDVSAALNDAQGYMERGLAELTPGEAGQARSLNGLLSYFEVQFEGFLIA